MTSKFLSNPKVNSVVLVAIAGFALTNCNANLNSNKPVAAAANKSALKSSAVTAASNSLLSGTYSCDADLSKGSCLQNESITISADLKTLTIDYQAISGVANVADPETCYFEQPSQLSLSGTSNSSGVAATLTSSALTLTGSSLGVSTCETALINQQKVTPIGSASINLNLGEYKVANDRLDMTLNDKTNGTTVVTYVRTSLAPAELGGSVLPTIPDEGNSVSVTSEVVAPLVPSELGNGAPVIPSEPSSVVVTSASGK